MMGSPPNEVGRCLLGASGGDESPHQVTLTRPFFIGVFPVTQGQYTRIMGYNPSYRTGPTRPVESVGLTDIRGSTNWYSWPMIRTVDPNSFMGRLRRHTGLPYCDLPTEAQWEYACRAGTTTALNNGTNLSNPSRSPELNVVGQYVHGPHNQRSNPFHLPVGSAYFPPNRWGIYDMHGNICEWCLDLFQDRLGTAPVTDPIGPMTNGSGKRISRGGSYCNEANHCRSANRSTYNGSAQLGNDGFRVVFTIP